MSVSPSTCLLAHATCTRQTPAFHSFSTASRYCLLELSLELITGWWENGRREGPGILCGILSDGTLVPVIFCRCENGCIHEYIRFEGTSKKHNRVMEAVTSEMSLAIAAAQRSRRLAFPADTAPHHALQH